MALASSSGAGDSDAVGLSSPRLCFCSQLARPLCSLLPEKVGLNALNSHTKKQAVAWGPRVSFIERTLKTIRVIRGLVLTHTLKFMII